MSAHEKPFCAKHVLCSSGMCVDMNNLLNEGYLATIKSK